MESFDSRNTIVPLFLLQVTNACRQMRPGGKVKIITDDAAIAADLKRLLAACEHRLVVVEREDKSGGKLKIWLVKKSSR